MKRSSRLGLLGLLASSGLLLVAGCNGSVGGSTNPGTGNSGGPGTAGSTGGSSTGTGGTGPACVGVCVCTPGIPPTSQIPRMTRAQYDQVVNDLLGVTTLASASNGTPSSLLTEDSSGPLTDISWNGYLSAAEKVAGAVMASTTLKAKYISCDPTAAGTTGTTCLTNTIKAFGRKAFRRPLTDTEVTSFMRFNSLTPTHTGNDVAEAILYAFLASPSFISLPELGQTMDPNNAGALQLTSYEVATRLSFLIWNSVPDDMLSTAADNNQLTTAAQIRAQAARMLQSPKAAAIASTFHRMYANIANGTHWTNNNTHTIGNFTSATYNDAMSELDAFFADVVVSGGSFASLWTSPNAFVTKNTASIYGVTSTATTPTKTALDATKRPGFLSRVGFLSTFAHDTTSSPILRGAFITQQVLAIPVGDPDPSFIGMQPMTGTFTTYRDAVTALTMNAPCNSCHTQKVNPPGFVMERYNAVGAWQDTDPLGGAINSTADVILSTVPLVTKTLNNPSELMAEIAKAPNAQRHYAEKFVSFASGRSPNQNDTCIVDTLSTNMATPTYSVASMMADYTQADSFRLRTLGN
jgi:uncharacterized protein DUF1592/uncharacterized protein DUF1588/uncharacterized protein DUF1585/uncharacterized protein DUF1595